MAITLGDVGTPTSVNPGTSIVGNVPSAVVNGDLLLWVVAGAGAGVSISIPAPTGWSIWQATQAQGTTISQTVFSRFAVSEPSSYTVSGLASARYTSAMVAYRGVSTSTPNDAANVINGSGLTYAPFGPITTASSDAWVIGVASLITAVGYTATSWTTSFTADASISSTSTTLTNSALVVGHLSVATPGSTTLTAVPSGTPGKGLSLASALRPAATTAYHSHRLVGAGRALVDMDITLL